MLQIRIPFLLLLITLLCMPVYASKQISFNTKKMSQACVLQFGKLKINTQIQCHFEGLHDTNRKPLRLTIIPRQGKIIAGTKTFSYQLVQEDRDMPLTLGFELANGEMTFLVASEPVGKIKIETVNKQGILKVTAPRGAIKSIQWQQDTNRPPQQAVNLKIAPQTSDYKPVPENWEQYFGIHYSTKNPNHAYRTVRGFGGPAMDPTIVDPHMQVNTHTGPFDQTTVQVSLPQTRRRKFGKLNPPVTQLLPMARKMNLDIIGSPMGMTPTSHGANRDRAYWILREMIEFQPDFNQFVYLQIGNEINGIHSFDPRNFKSKIKQKGVTFWDYFNTEQTLKDYAEFMLAPGIQVIRKVSQDAYNDPHKLKILSGSVANIFNPKSRDWAQKMLDYRFEGTAVSQIKGKLVSDEIDILTVHYAMAHKQSHKVLDELRERFLLTNKVTGIWITEDHGRRGNGPVDITRRSVQFLHWITRHQLSSMQSRICWWGTGLKKAGGKPIVAIKQLGQIFGNSQLQITHTATPQMQIYSFVINPSKQSPSYANVLIRNDKSTGNLGKISFKPPATNNSDEPWQVQWIAYSSTTMPVIKLLNAKRLNGTLTALINEPLTEINIAHWTKAPTAKPH